MVIQLRPLFRSSVLIASSRGFAKSPAMPFSGVFPTRAAGVNAHMFRTRVLAASFSTVSKNTNPDFKDIQTILERDHFLKIKQRIEQDDRRRISLEEFQQIASEEGLSKDLTTRLLQSLNDSGVILYFPNSANSKLQNSIFLKPSEVNKTIHHLLDHYSPAALKVQAETVQAEMRDIIHQLEPLKTTRDELDHKAHRRANLILGAGLGYCVLQFLAIGRLTWWELSWDVMEPVTYMLTFATVLIGYSYFVATGTEYTFEGLKRTLRERRLQKLIKRTGFDEAKFKQLHQALQKKEVKLHEILDEINHAGATSLPELTNNANKATTPSTPTPAQA